jgi:hypothetical protein
MLFHEIYEIVPNPVTKLIGSYNESVFQHLKSGFNTYILISVIEYFTLKEKDTIEYISNRLFSSVLVPWLLCVLWYTGPAVAGGRIPGTFLHVLFSIVITYLGGYFAAVLDSELAQFKFSKQFKWIIGILTVLFILLGTLFTIDKPYIDLFEDPQERLYKEIKKE